MSDKQESSTGFGLPELIEALTFCFWRGQRVGKSAVFRDSEDPNDQIDMNAAVDEAIAGALGGLGLLNVVHEGKPPEGDE